MTSEGIFFAPRDDTGIIIAIRFLYEFYYYVLNLFAVHFNLLGGDHTYIKIIKECSCEKEIIHFFPYNNNCFLPYWG